LFHAGGRLMGASAAADMGIGAGGQRRRFPRADNSYAFEHGFQLVASAFRTKDEFAGPVTQGGGHIKLVSAAAFQIIRGHGFKPPSVRAGH
ncbi:MAG: hypothetical protein NVV74_15460, partial [Magnetospirillum sp.]|nr:hypothetical protein [Magnetospirillum sp.]